MIKDLYINDQIRAKEVRLKDENNQMIGIVSLQEAKEYAQRAELDLVLLNAKAQPPVAQIMNYSKYKFEQIKKEKEAKKRQKTIGQKEVWLSATIEEHDLNTKARQAIKFLQSNNKVRASIILRGRQNARPELALNIMQAFYEIVKDYGELKNRPNKEGRAIFMDIEPITEKKK